MTTLDLRTRAAFPVDRAIAESQLDFIWKATLQPGTVICEQPGLSSEHLPREEVTQMEYVPTRGDLPVVTCRVDLDKGERFVRYWTNLWSPQRRGTQRIYILGLENRQGQYALVGFYPMFKKFVLSTQRPFSPKWVPETTTHLPPQCIVRGGPGTNYIGWVHEGFGGTVLAQNKSSLLFAAAYA